MPSQDCRPFRAILFGLEENLAGELSRALAQLGIRSRDVDSGEPAEVFLKEADVVFSASEPSKLTSLVRIVRRVRPELPVVVASRYPEAASWIDSLERGADDYCCAPFESISLRWILETNVHRRAYAAA